MTSDFGNYPSRMLKSFQTSSKHCTAILRVRVVDSVPKPFEVLYVKSVLRATNYFPAGHQENK